MAKLRLFLVISVFALLAAACGGGSSSSTSVTPSNPVSVSLSELSTTIEVSTTHQFTATVSNADDQSVDWQVNNVTGGNSIVGTISESGLYTAPDHVPTPTTVTVTAIAHADATKTASATVTVMSNITVTVSPAMVTIPAGETQQFTASVQNTTETAVTWKVNDVAGGSAALGIISSAGLYTAPSVPPPGGTVTITAVSAAEPGQPGSASVTVRFSNISFKGPYIFSCSGNDPDGPFYTVGRLVSDGKGNITNGTEDYQKAGASSQRMFTGTYQIASEKGGLGSMALLVSGLQEAENFRFQLTSAGQGSLIRFDSSSTGSGQIFKQDSASFSNASLNGPYVFQLVATALPGTIAIAGVFTSDGAGNITSGMEDFNDGKNIMSKVPITGSYSVNPDGRAVLTLAVSIGTGTVTSHSVTYLISTDRGLFMNIDNQNTSGVGMAEKQQATSFSNGSLSGDFVYTATGEPATDRNVSHGRFTADGAGAISAGMICQHDAKTQLAFENFTGSYSIPAADKGRGVLTFNTPAGPVNFVLYLVSDNKAFLAGIDTSSPKGGQLVTQQGVPFYITSLEGDFVFSLRGFDPFGEVSAVGTVNLNATGLPTGFVAVNHAGTLTDNAAIYGEYDLVRTNGFGYLDTLAGENFWWLSLIAVDASNASISVDIVPDEFTFGSLLKEY